jgi:hypothetical protein
MINDLSLQHCANLKSSALFSDHFTRPSSVYSFAALPQTFLDLLGVEARANTLIGALPHDCLGSVATRFDHLIVIFLDAFGWELAERLFAEAPLLGRCIDTGTLSKLTSQFPSTTAAHVTTAHSGLPIAESMIPNWFYYEPSLDAAISPLLGSYACDGSRRETLREAGVALDTLLPSASLYEVLASAGVRSYSYQSEQFCHSTYTKHATRGAQLVPFASLTDGLGKLVEALGTQSPGSRSYHALYCDSLDGVCHKYGSTSDGAIEHATRLLVQIEKALFSKTQALPKNAGIVLIADHGHVVSPSTEAIYLDAAFPEILPMLRRSGDGKVIAPCGANRDYFLHVKPQYIDELVAYLGDKLAGRCAVVAVNELVKAGYFLDDSLPALLKQRLGDVAVLPFAGESCFWSDGGRHVLSAYSSHGGLTEAEMMIPCGVLGI